MSNDPSGTVQDTRIGVLEPIPWVRLAKLGNVVAALPWLGLTLYILNLLLGVGVQFRLVSTRRIHWVHHALYAVVFAGAFAAMLGLIVAGSRWWPLILTVLALGFLPRFRGGSRQHMALAGLGFVGYVLALA